MNQSSKSTLLPIVPTTSSAYPTQPTSDGIKLSAEPISREGMDLGKIFKEMVQKKTAAGLPQALAAKVAVEQFYIDIEENIISRAEGIPFLIQLEQEIGGKSREHATLHVNTRLPDFTA